MNYIFVKASSQRILSLFPGFEIPITQFGGVRVFAELKANSYIVKKKHLFEMIEQSWKFLPEGILSAIFLPDKEITFSLDDCEEQMETISE